MDKANYYQAQHANYYIKAYDKAKQNRHITGVPKELLRIELKYVKMNDIVKYLNNLNIHTGNKLSVADTGNIDLWKALGDLIVNKWNEILFFDYTINRKRLSRKQKSQYDQYSNVHFWEGLSRQKKYKELIKFKSFTENHSDHLQDKIATLIISKLQELLSETSPTISEQPRLSIDSTISTTFDYKILTISNLIEKYGDIFTNSKGDCPLVTYDNVEEITGALFEIKEREEGRRINSILIRLNGQLIPWFNLSHFDKETPNYQEWINQPGELPF
ncbi:hypothetical protein [Namhaeicola litoreus]|uniref:Uncharacterized protein n=1 Tax=Namhaeicola litoreus TaxID=1052145 RepID=A0ABW3XYF1_9FLAO